MKSLFKDQLNFRVITLQEPPKDELVPYLDAEHRGDDDVPAPQRCARVEVLVKTSTNDNDLIELIIDLNLGSVVKQEHLVGKHSYIDAAYMKEVEEACMADSRVQDEVKALQLPDEASVIVEPWAYATDGSNDMSKRITMVCPPTLYISFTLISFSAGSTLASPHMQTQITTPTHSIYAPKFQKPSK